MKLRNKKTGEIINGGFVVCEYKDGARFSVKDKPCFDSLDELKEEWEDYKPTEPYIKDKEIISLLRPWIKFNKIEKAIILKGSNDSWFHIKGEDRNECWWDIEIHRSYSESVDKDYHGGFVDIKELCGEEE